MNRFFQRSVGVLVIFTVLLVIVLMFTGIVVSGSSTMVWNPKFLYVFDGLLPLWYSDAIPSLNILLTALVIAAVMVTIVVVTERVVSKRYRRTPLGVSNRSLSPKTIMAATRQSEFREVTVTVLIPAHNEEASLPATLLSLRQQRVQPDRVLVVADNCTDGTVAIARQYGVEVFETVNNTDKKGGALNQALKELLPDLGDNDTVLVMDADTQLSAGFLEKAVQLFRGDRALMAVGGLFTGEDGGGMLGQFQRNEYFRYQREIRRREGRVFVLTGTGTVFRSAALRGVAAARGGVLPGRVGEVYDTLALTEDNELTIAIKSLGGLIISPDE
ncbi:MAG: glycosyltransferase family 2 protein, partial [Microbacteriaceae bacterium]